MSTGTVVGAGFGGLLGSHVGIAALGGAISGTLPIAIVGGIIGSLLGRSWSSVPPGMEHLTADERLAEYRRLARKLDEHKQGAAAPTLGVKQPNSCAEYDAAVLVEQEVSNLYALVDGVRSPCSGMEIRFLKIVRGEAKPCSPLERNWLKLIAVREAHIAAPSVLPPIVNLAQRNAELEALVKQAAADLAQHKKWLEGCHTTIRQLQGEIAAAKIEVIRAATQYDDDECHACGKPLAFCACAR